MSTSKELGFRAGLKRLIKRPVSPLPKSSPVQQDGRASTSQTNPARYPSELMEEPTTATPLKAVASPPLMYVRNEPGQRIFDAALGGLEDEDRNTINCIIVVDDIDGIKGVQDAILGQQKKCEEAQWKMSVKGHELSLGAVAGAMLLVVQKLQPGIDFVSEVAGVLQPGIDLAASVAPLHIGLPVALIKAILGVTVFFRDQMERLLLGIKTAIYMLQYLSLHFEYFKRVEAPAEAKFMEDQLTSSYGIVLAFLAAGHRALTKRGPSRAWELLWSKETVDQFEKNSDEAGRKLEAAADHCHRDGAQKQLYAIKEQIDQVVSEMKQVDIVQATIQALNIMIDLQRLRSANGAAFDFVDSNKEGTIYDYCLPGTRRQLISEISAWCHESHQTVFWICGMAGTGKSTLVRTVARQIEAEGLLAASFFFRQDVADQKNGALFVSSIVTQLLTKHPILRPYVSAALDADLTLPGGSMSNQFTKLLKEPLYKAGLHRLVLVIDALDECSMRDAKNILIQLGQFAKQFDLRIVIASRPEPELRAIFDNVKPDSIRLEEVQEEIENDIRLFIEKRFESLKAKDAKKQAPRLIGWPENGTIETLVRLTMPLFIFAATLFRYLEERMPKARLAAVLQQGQSTSLTGIHRVYLPILEHIYQDEDADVISDFKLVVGCIVLLQDPLSLFALSSLLGKPPGDVEEVLDSLHSVLSIPARPDKPIRLLHKSFKDFLLDSDSKYKIDVTKTHLLLRERCLDLLETLVPDICKVGAPGTERRGVDNIGDCIKPELEYACIHWTSHIEQYSLQDGCRSHQFLQRHFLHWLEALSWLGRLPSAFSYLRLLRSCVKAGQGFELSAFLDDALRFVRKNRHVVDLFPLQLYYSALIFAPSNSMVRKNFQYEIQAKFVLLPEVPPTWDAEVLRLQGVGLYPPAIAFSPYSKFLALGFGDGTLQVWDVTTGEERYAFEAQKQRIKAVNFAPNDQLIASISEDCTLYVWDVATGEVLHRLGTPHLPCGIGIVEFSPDSNLFTSAFKDHTICIWDTWTGKKTNILRGHGVDIYSIIFSSDSKRLASSSRDGIVCLWDVESGEQRLKLGGQGEAAKIAIFCSDHTLLAIGFEHKVHIWDAATGLKKQDLIQHDSKPTRSGISADGSLLAIADETGAIHIWNPLTGIQKIRLEKVDRHVQDLVFSADGKLLASQSDFEAVTVWEIATGKIRFEFLHSSWVSLTAFSSDSLLLATISRNLIFVWDMTANTHTQRYAAHNKRIIDIALSPDSKLLASASADRTVQLWDATNQQKEIQLKVHQEVVHRATFSAGGERLAAWSVDRSIRVWDSATGQEQHKFVAPFACDRFVFSPTGKMLAAGSWDAVVRVWDIDTGAEIWKLQGHWGPIWALVFSPDSKILASGSNDTIRLWDVERGVETMKFEHHGQSIEVLAFSHDGKLLASGSGRNEVCVWDLTSAKLQRKLGDYRYRKYALAFSLDDKLLVSLCDYSISVWEIATGKEIQQIEVIDARTLSFSADGRKLSTGIGEFDFDAAERKQPIGNAPLELREEWLRCRGQDVLWLPHEYRGTCSIAFGETLVIGQASGGVSFFKVPAKNLLTGKSGPETNA